MSFTWEQIVATMTLRRSNDSSVIQRMIDIRDRYNNDVVVPVVEMPDQPEMRALMPQLIHDGIEGYAMRAAAQMPAITIPALKPSSQRSREFAAIRRRALYASWSENSLSLLLRRAFRQLSGYATFSMVVMPDHEKGRARIELRDPLTAYPELRAPEQIDPPRNVGFVYGRSAHWIARHYPEAREYVLGRPGPGQNTPVEQLWDVVEWIDEDHVVIGLLGPREASLQQGDITKSGGMELRRWPNRAGMVPVAIPQRITLDRIAGQMDSIVGIVDWMAKLMALDVLAAEKDIFPDIAVIGDENRVPELIGGEWKDGRSGEVNLLTGVRGLQMLHTTPGPMTERVMGGLERAGRMASGATPLYGGDNPNALRTGRAIDTIGAFAVDPMVAELQDIMSRALERSINPAILEVEKGYWPNKTFTVFSGWRGDQGVVEYTPSKHFEATHNSVSYSFPGTDMSQITVALAQLVGAGLVSQKTARAEHPLIDNPEQEEDGIVKERLTDALLQSILQQAVAGQMPAIDVAQVIKYVEQGMEIPDAILKADEAARARQAAQAPPPQPGQMTAPEQQPGLAMPGMGAESAPAPPNQPVPQGLQNASALMAALRSTSNAP